MSRIHAFADDALGDHDAVALTEMIARGEVSAPELVEAAITRIDQVDPALGAVAYRDWDRARREAKRPLPGFFSGVPTLVKDNSDVAGMPSRHGCDAFVAGPARQDGDFAAMYRRTGLLVMGKSQLSEFGFSASAEHPRLGPVRNPWDTERTAGASSSGAAALVAAGALPIAHANDGGGSIRIPASVNGLVGFKPTRNRIAQDKMTRDMPVRIVADGVVTRSVRDTAAFLREAEKVHRNLKLAPVGDIQRPGRRRLKVALVTTSVGRSASPEVAELTRATGRLLEQLGHHVEEVEPPVPAYFPADFQLYWSLLASFMVLNGKRTFNGTWDRSRLDNLTLGLFRHFKKNVHRLPLATTRLAASGAVSQRFFAGYDVVLTPTLAHETPRIGHLDPTQEFEVIMDRLLDWVAFTPLQNATGDPAISLPLAATANGLPQGMMFGAARGQEATLLELAFELEEARPFARIQGVVNA
ncbi:amidase [Nocardioides daejeonensis]|uniref:amidase n=1 Tax=Nocardioides daejeonensis TaxID=1046556 RepID=UPI000D74C5ED|nr:amidase [Nocardioides daejeonensis]